MEGKRQSFFPRTVKEGGSLGRGDSSTRPLNTIPKQGGRDGFSSLLQGKKEGGSQRGKERRSPSASQGKNSQDSSNNGVKKKNAG